MSKWWISQEVGGVVWHLMPSYTSIGEFIFDFHFVMYTLHGGFYLVYIHVCVSIPSCFATSLTSYMYVMYVVVHYK